MNGFTFDKLVTFIKEIGIPTALALFVLVRLEPAIQGNTKAINELTVVVSKVTR